jgi:glutathione S-transferase
MELASGQDHLAGTSLTLADITLLTTIEFAGFIGMSPLEDVPAIQRWLDRASARPSVSGKV